METIKKYINLRDFIEKFGENEPHINVEETSYTAGSVSGSSYGHIPYDIKLSNGMPYIFMEMPSYFTDNTHEVIGIKYGTFAECYNMLRNFILNSKYYILGKRHSNYVWVETGSTLGYKEEEGVGKYFLFSASTGVFQDLPDAHGFVCGESIICVGEDNFFVSYSGETVPFFKKYTISDAVEFLDYAETNIFKGNYERLSPFIEFPILIQEKIDNLGDEELVIQEDDEETVSVDIEEDPEQAYYVESKLKTLKRDKTSIEDNGDLLDFYYNSADNRCEILYVTNVPKNAYYDDRINAYKYDIISSVVCIVEDEDEETELDYNDLTQDDIGAEGIITFTYVIGNMLLDVSDTTVSDASGGGIEYEDKYRFRVQSKTFTIDGVKRTLPYIKIEYKSIELPENVDDGKIYAKVKIQNKEEPMLHSNHLIRTDSSVGYEDILFNENEIKIDRGASASYEAFNVLGEVNSLEDIEKYHDDWYRIKGKND